MGAVNGVVGGDMQVIRIRVQLAFPFGNVNIIIIPGGSSHVHLQILGGFSGSAVGEIAAVNIIGLALDAQIHGHGGELHGGAAMEEEHGISVRNVHKSAQARLRIVNDGLIHGAAMAHFHHVHARIAVHRQRFLHLFQHRQGQHGGAGRKIIYAFHCFKSTFLGFPLSGSISARRARIDLA